MLKKYIYFVLFVLSLVVIVPNNSILANSELTTDSVITGDNVHQVFEYLDIDTSEYNKNEIEKEVESSSEITIGELKEAVKEINEMPDKMVIEKTAEPSVNLSNGDEDFTPFSTRTVTVSEILDYESFTITYRQAGVAHYSVQWDVWREALGSSASISSPPVSGVSYSITSEWYSAYVSSPNRPGSVLHQASELTVEGTVFGVKLTELEVSANINWNTSHVYR